MNTKKKRVPIDLSKILLPFKNKWVAISMDYKKILGSGKTLSVAAKQADKTGKEYTVYKVVPEVMLQAPLGLLKVK